MRRVGQAVIVFTLDVRQGRDGNTFIIKPGDWIYVPEVIF